VSELSRATTDSANPEPAIVTQQVNTQAVELKTATPVAVHTSASSRKMAQRAAARSISTNLIWLGILWGKLVLLLDFREKENESTICYLWGVYLELS